MTRLAQTERTALCDTALQVGQDQPTLCDGWTVKDLVVHLLLREGSPAAVGILLAPLAGLTERASRRLGRSDFAVLVERLRNGPPRLSPFAIPKVDEMANTMEFFVHLEDIRRAQPDWSPRILGDDVEKVLWSMVATPGKALTRSSPVGVTIENATTGSTKVVKEATPSVTVKGLPSEVALFLFGRSEQARVELLGDDVAVARLRGASLGL
ncbi:MAG: TIGR03085 family metal-binding protein [Nocardioidaceae bacterium]